MTFLDALHCCEAPNTYFCTTSEDDRVVHTVPFPTRI